MDDENSKKSVFNAGVAMTERIDGLQIAINSARFNLLAKNMEIGKFNYEIIIAANDGLLQEVWSKLSEKEKDMARKIQTVVHDYVEMNPLIINANGKVKIHKENLKKFVEISDFYERTIKDFLEEHNLNAPSKEEEDEDEY